MRNTATTLSLAGLTLLSLFLCALAIRRLRQPDPEGRLRRRQRSLTLLCLVGSLAVFGLRWVHYGRWQPLEAHVDGLLLIAILLNGCVLFLQSQARLAGLGAFVLPIQTFLFAWAVCASAWTLRFYPNVRSVWQFTHLLTVYLGTIFFVIAAAAGVMYLYVQWRLRAKRDLARLGRLASLEAVEGAIVRASGLGFAVLTLGLATGLIRGISDPALIGPAGWRSPKVVLGVAAWALYGLVMNVRHTSTFRGARAAWLSIAGLVLILATFAVTNARLPRAGGATGGPAAPAALRPTPSAPPGGEVR